MSNAIIKELTDAEIESMSYDRLVRLMLHHIVHSGLYSRTELLRDLRLENTDTLVVSGPLNHSRSKLETAVSMLYDKDLVSSNSVRGDEDGIVLTSEGTVMLDIEDFRYRSVVLERVSERVLHRELQHSRLCFLEGQYEDAMSTSLESIRARVRTLSNSRKPNLDGAKLVKHAFGKKSALSGVAGHQTMSEAVAALFAGALEVDPNTLTYGRRTSLEFVHSVTEVILFANLLHHLLDQYDQQR